MTSLREDFQLEVDGSFLRQTESNELLTIGLIDSRETFVENQTNPVLSVSIFEFPSQVRCRARASNFFVESRREDDCTVGSVVGFGEEFVERREDPDQGVFAIGDSSSPDPV